MKNIVLGIKNLMVLGITFSFIGVSSVSATRAVTDRGTGCFIRVGTGDDDYAFDSTCTAHDVLKMDDDGNLEFYVYQDHGQLPGSYAGQSGRPFPPSGEYESSFKSH